MALLAVAVSAATAQDLVIYDEVLHAGWQSWSWAQVDTGSATVVHGGGRSIEVRIRGGGQALALHHAPLPSSPYAALTFWIHGGGAGGTIALTDLRLQDAAGAAQAAFYLDDIALAALPAPEVVHVSVDAGHVVRTVDERVFGLNATMWDEHLATPETTALLAADFAPYSATVLTLPPAPRLQRRVLRRE